MEAALVLSERHGATAVLKWNRPAKLNAITSEMYSLMAAALREADADPQVRAIVITGSGKSFTAGNDLVDFVKAPPDGPDAPVMHFLRAIAAVEKPLIAAVSGAAVGVGTTLLLHCDLVYTTKDARFALPFVQLGLCPEAASSLLLPRLCGYQRAAEKLLLGEPFTAQEAYAMGLVTRVLDDASEVGGESGSSAAVQAAEAVQNFALSQAAKLAALPRSALRVSKALMKADSGAATLTRINEEATQFAALLAGPAAQEALAAFTQKRRPDFPSID